MNKYSLKKSAFFTVLFLFTVFSGGRFAFAEESSGLAVFKDVEVEFYGGWDSKYASEGRNELSSGGVYTFGTSLGYKGLSVAFDHLAGDKEQYSEVNIGVGYGVEFHEVELSVGYTRLEFTHDNTKDNEFFAEAGYGGLPFVSGSVGYVYSTEEDGSFVEIGASVDIPQFFGSITVFPYVLQSFDFGYITPEHDGANNFQIGVEVDVAIWDKAALVFHLNHSFEQSDIKEEIKADNSVEAAGTWGGVQIVLAL